MSACFCVGPQRGQPLCPCKMRDVTIRDGRYVRVQDLGPAKKLCFTYCGDERCDCSALERFEALITQAFGPRDDRPPPDKPQR